ncbi:alkylation response protein AidB-like acyl-CoA dehydrogenase [Pseudoduganella lurida]|uniref:Dibenzothiophene monooxygenase n=1 Tax=Pseudoduganella lurida TaxID=1036180 RepID=A0A562RFI1_9BURK|nr:acyl-CoA dehydrogenase family protein [Pseudoduganella lurida]TWI67334.1 alkylation response protein AidB-like acyl-CoA dehydrogenase [Pseudoduganella lurida]
MSDGSNDIGAAGQAWATDRDPTDAELQARFRPIFARIAAGAVEREAERKLPHEEVQWLRQAGFGAVRIPRSYGGLGATLPQFFGLLLELATADSNVSHLLRGHFSFLESRLNHEDEATRAFWFPKVVDGALIGYAMAEQSAVTGTSATIVRDGEGWRLNGKKYYSTGTIYADWIVATVLDGETLTSVAFPATLPGVTRLDDWDGFGQRMTGSGTTVFENVRLRDDHIVRRFDGKFAPSYHKAFLQLVLLTSIAGAGRAALQDAIAFVQRKTRAFDVKGESSPRHDPLVQRVVGRLASLSYAADSIVDNVARTLEDTRRQSVAGTADEALFVAADIRAFQAQQVVIDLVLQASTLLFEVGGASATSESRRLDRHWRNARTAASHNPAIFRERMIGDYYLNGTVPPVGPWTAPATPVEEGAPKQ